MQGNTIMRNIPHIKTYYPGHVIVEEKREMMNTRPPILVHQGNPIEIIFLVYSDYDEPFVFDKYSLEMDVYLQQDEETIQDEYSTNNGTIEILNNGYMTVKAQNNLIVGDHLFKLFIVDHSGGGRIMIERGYIAIK